LGCFGSHNAADDAGQCRAVRWKQVVKQPCNAERIEVLTVRHPISMEEGPDARRGACARGG
jgi:hypothetical protein